MKEGSLGGPLIVDLFAGPGGWAADWGERLGACTARPVFDMDGGGPQCSWCGAIWPLCGHHHLSTMPTDDDERTTR